MIRADLLLFSFRSELSEQKFARQLAQHKAEVSDEELASHAGFIEALEWGLEEIERQVVRADAA
jgi:hypothetical protein